jgi:hypothetical protein
MYKSRRQFLVIAGLAPVALLMVGNAHAEGAACYDPANASLADKNRRRSLGYVDASGDEKRRCGHCAFFTATQGACGTCQLMTGAPVVATGVCKSFAPKG